MTKKLFEWRWMLISLLAILPMSLWGESQKVSFTCTSQKQVGEVLHCKLSDNNMIDPKNDIQLSGSDLTIHWADGSTETFRTGDITLKSQAFTIDGTLNSGKVGFTSMKEVQSSTFSWILNVQGSVNNLNLRGCTKLSTLICENLQLKSLNVTQCPKLLDLYCRRNQLKSLDISQCPKLERLDCSSNQLKDLDISKCDHLITMKLNENQLGFKEMDRLLEKISSNMQKMDVKLDAFTCVPGNILTKTQYDKYKNDIPFLEDKPGFIRFPEDKFYHIFFGSDPVRIEGLEEESHVEVAKGSILHLVALPGYVVESVNGVPYDPEKGYQVNSKEDADFDIKVIKASVSFTCTSQRKVGESVHCDLNDEDSVDSGIELSGSDLTIHWADGTTEAFRTGDIKLKSQKFTIDGTLTDYLINLDRMEEVEISTSVNKITFLSGEGSSINKLTIKNAPNLTNLACQMMQLKSLDISGCPNLMNLRCAFNQLTALDVSKCSRLNNLEFANNHLGVKAMDQLLEEVSKLKIENFGCLPGNILTKTQYDKYKNDIPFQVIAGIFSGYKPLSEDEFYHISFGSKPVRIEGLEKEADVDVAKGSILHLVALPGYEIESVNGHAYDPEEGYRVNSPIDAKLDIKVVRKSADAVGDVNQIGINVYPNPVANEMQIRVPNDFVGKTAYLYNMSGQIVRAIRLTEVETRAEVSQLPSGQYLLRLAHHVQKIIKK